MDKLVVRGTEINVQWDLKRDDFLSLTDIAKIKDSDNPRKPFSFTLNKICFWKIQAQFRSQKVVYKQTFLRKLPTFYEKSGKFL